MKLAVVSLKFPGWLAGGMVVALLSGGCVSPTPSWDTWDRPGATPLDFARDLDEAEKQFDVFRALSLNQPLPLHARGPFEPRRPQANPLLNPFTALLGPALVGIHKPDFISNKLRQNGWRRRGGRPLPPAAIAAANPLPPKQSAQVPIFPPANEPPVIPPPPQRPRLAVGLPPLPNREPKAKIIQPPESPAVNFPVVPLDAKPLAPIGEVTLAQPGARTVMINAGRLKGVQLKQRLQVQRQSEVIGELEAGEIFRDISLCRIISSKTPIRAGDSVSPANPKPILKK